MLYLVPTPVGNLEDITLRAIQTLKDVDLILAEDTRTSKSLLVRYEIDTPIRSYHSHNEHHITESITASLEGGQKMALVTDAGSPGISDPGFLLVRACVEKQIPVIPLPGATAFIPALTASGLPCDRFHFEGFLPHKKGRQTRWKFLNEYPYTFVLYESPFRLIKCLEEAKTLLNPSRKVCVAREISKVFEEITTGSIEELLAHYQDRKVKGEIVIVFGPPMAEEG